MLLATRTSARGLATVNVVTFVVNTVVTGVSQTGLFGKDMSDVSDAYPTMVTPKSWAFNIWILIFLFEAVFTLALFRERGRNSIYVRRITGWSRFASPFLETTKGGISALCVCGVLTTTTTTEGASKPNM